MNSFNRELPLLAEMPGPTFLPAAEIEGCKTHRDAVRLCWMRRRVKGMTQAYAAALLGVHAPHMSCFLSAKPKTGRSLPADAEAEFQNICGNYAIQQWRVRQAGLHLAEEMMQKMAA